MAHLDSWYTQSAIETLDLILNTHLPSYHNNHHLQGGVMTSEESLRPKAAWPNRALVLFKLPYQNFSPYSMALGHIP